jgi:hypothetical protein
LCCAEELGDDEDDGGEGDDVGLDPRPSIWKMHPEEFEKMLSRLLSDDRQSLRLNCISWRPIEFWTRDFSEEYKRNMKERSLLNWQPGASTAYGGLELKDPAADGELDTPSAPEPVL